MDQLTRIQQLLAENKFEEAQTLITAALQQPLTSQDRGDIALGVMSTYLTVLNAINSRYEQALKDAVEDLEAAQQLNELLSQKVSGQSVGQVAAV